MGGKEFKLILGTPLETTVHPWRFLRIKAVMVNAYSILSSGKLSTLRGRGLRRALGLPDDVELWLDSGGYQFLRAGVDPGPAKIARIYREIDADYYVSLDYPPSPNDPPDVRALKIARTVAAFQTMKSMLRGKVEDGRLIPVFHLSTGEALRIQYTVYYPSSCIAAVGGLIPYFMQRAGRYSRLKALLFLILVRKLWDGYVHALGVASAAVIPLLKVVGIDSGDTQTWRHKAAYGKIIIPGVGERHISRQEVKFGPAKLREDEYEVYNKLVSRARELFGVDNSTLVTSFEARALFNAWILTEVARNGFGYNGVSKPFQRLYELAKHYLQLSREAVEEELARIMRGEPAALSELGTAEKPVAVDTATTSRALPVSEAPIQ